MRRTTLFWKIFPVFLGIVLLSLLAMLWYTSRELHVVFMARMKLHLERQARLVEHCIHGDVVAGNWRQLDQQARRIAELTGSRITVIDLTGRPVADSHEDPARMDDHSQRPEFRLAMRGDTGSSERYSGTLGENLIYVAIPVERNGRVIGAVRAAYSMQSFEAALAQTYRRIVAGGLVVGMAGVLVSFMAARRLARPLAEIRTGAERFAQGNLQDRLPEFEVAELNLLGQTMNQMAAHLDDRIRTAIQQRNELEAILSSMSEGVLAVDTGANVITMNQAAADMLGVDLAEAEGKAIQAVARNAALQNLVAETLGCETRRSSRIVFRNDHERHVQVNATPVKNAEGSRIGAVVVLNDITQMRKLEKVRKDFVANVSHEIRTPITSIKGFVETLLDGALADEEDARRFLTIILEQANRLNAIIEDLLALSRLEREDDEAELTFELHRIKDILVAAIKVCSGKASERSIDITLECPEDIQADLNPLLLEQAVVNILDNAVNYSDPNTRIEVGAHRVGDEIQIAVADSGCGIPREDLPRIFERFYRVDKGRSRELGGTGLGLAIVKHIVQTHGGRVSVDSRLNTGTTFRIHLPAAR